MYVFCLDFFVSLRHAISSRFRRPPKCNLTFHNNIDGQYVLFKIYLLDFDFDYSYTYLLMIRYMQYQFFLVSKN